MTDFDPAARPSPSAIVRRMRARDRDEPSRAATPLELLFDLVFVVAVSQAASQLVPPITEAHPGMAFTHYLMIFFAVWWAWMNFSWFASAYDSDDVPYRLMTVLQMAGALVLAAGVPRAFQHENFTVVWSGYAVMRLAMVGQWARAAWSVNGVERRTAVRYASGVVACQVGWLGLLLLPTPARAWLFLGMAVAELSVPPWAEHGQRTSWHPRHIAERYGLFTIIVLGETVSAATVAVQSALDKSAPISALLPIAGGGLMIVFASWWIYFAVPVHAYLSSSRAAFLWGYGSYLLFASAAAIGAGLEVAVEEATGSTAVSVTAASAAVTVPAATFLLMVWLLHFLHQRRGVVRQAVLPCAVLLTLACTFAGHAAVPLAGVVTTLAMTAGLVLSARAERRAAG